MKKQKQKNIFKAGMVLIAVLMLVLSGTAMGNIRNFEEEATNTNNILDGEWIHFDDGVPVDGIGLCDTFEAAIRITPDELEGYDNHLLTAVRFYHSDSNIHSGNIRIYDGTLAPGPLITSEPYTVEGEGWFEIPLSNPVPLDASKDVWASVQMKITEHGEYPIGIDDGPAIDRKGDWVCWSDYWFELQEWEDFDCNWNIWAKVEPGGPIIKLELLNDQWSWGISVAIKNIGDADATDVKWYIAVDGLFFGLGTKNVSGQISIIPANAEDDVIIHSGIIFGLGPTTITIFAICAEGSWDKIVIEGKLFLFWRNIQVK